MITLQIGDAAPDFKALDESGNSISLADYKGKNSYCSSIQKPVLQAVLLKLVI